MKNINQKITILFFSSFICLISIAQLPCNNWLKTNSTGQYASLGDIDVTGNQITVEAVVNKLSDNSTSSSGHIVSKHNNSTNLNYNLSIYGAEITTSITGYAGAFETCPTQLNKTYHVALVYDGINLKFYRNGFLQSTTPCTGNLINNNLITRISQVADLGSSIFANTQFVGYVNEVRIWNVARTMSQLNQFMFTTLPTPSTQVGLLAYYTFDNLQNKQGNSLFNASLVGGAINNSTNTSCTTIADSCCSKAFYAASSGDFATLGDLDVSGTQLTVEATARRTAPLNGGTSFGHIVSKQTNTTNVNYNLSLYGAEITTSVTGYVNAFSNCPTELNKTYHVAMVYDGVNLKFYRNGVLMASTPCVGSLINNDLTARIAQASDIGSNFALNTQFIGYVDEVKIWNVARTKEQIKSFVNLPLTNPGTQIGLLAYYNFNDLMNKQGNAAYNSILINSATINAANPNCTVIIDSCGILLPLKIKSFNVSQQTNSNNVSFELVNEKSVKSILLEKSIDGVNFKSIKSFSPLNNEQSNSYEFNDFDFNSEKAYYKIVILTSENKKIHSNIIVINKKINVNNFEFNVFSNPIKNNNFNLVISSVENGSMHYSITDLLGKTVFANKLQIVKGINTISVNIDHAIPKGVYFLTVKNATTQSTKKIIVD